jgi:hypothetical protein
MLRSLSRVVGIASVGRRSTVVLPSLCGCEQRVVWYTTKAKKPASSSATLLSNRPSKATAAKPTTPSSSSSTTTTTTTVSNVAPLATELELLNNVTADLLKQQPAEQHQHAEQPAKQQQPEQHQSSSDANANATSDQTDSTSSVPPQEAPVDFEKFARAFQAHDRLQRKSRQPWLARYLPPPDEFLNITLWIGIVTMGLQLLRRTFEVEDGEVSNKELAVQLTLQTNQLLAERGLPPIAPYLDNHNISAYGYAREQLVHEFESKMRELEVPESKRTQLKSLLIEELLRGDEQSPPPSTDNSELALASSSSSSSSSSGMMPTYTTTALIGHTKATFSLADCC